MARRITLKYPATCKECGADLPAGIKARYYGKGRVYGIDCHEDTRGQRPAKRSRVVVSTRCEDYPCCGHGPAPLGDDAGCPTVYEDGTETFACASCGGELPAGNHSAICDGCHGRAASRDEDERNGDFSGSGADYQRELMDPLS